MVKGIRMQRGSRKMLSRSAAAVLVGATLQFGCLGSFSSSPPYSLLLALASGGSVLNVDVRYLVGSGLQIQNAATGELVSVSSDGLAPFSQSQLGQDYSLSVTSQPASPAQTCSFVGAASGTLDQAVTAQLECSAAVSSVQPPLPGILATSQDIVVRFNRSMTAGSCILGGATTLTPAPAGYVWSSSKYANDTLTLQNGPWSIFTSAPGRTLELVGCLDADSLPPVANPIVSGVFVFNPTHVHYVTPSGSDATGDGLSPATAMATIDNAIADLTGGVGCAIGPNLCVVLVGAASGGSTYVQTASMANFVAVVGGYSTDFTVNNPIQYATILRDPGGCTLGLNLANDPCATVRFTDNLNASAAIQGFTIQGPESATYSAAVSMRDGGTVLYNTIQGAAAGGTVAGVFAGANTGLGGATIRNNTILGGGSSSTTSIGVMIWNPLGPDVAVQDNVINGGQGATTNGIRVAGVSRALMARNIVYSGGDSGGGATAYGIYIAGLPTNTTRIINNVIVGGRSDGTSALSAGIGLVNTGALVTIYHNTVVALSAAGQSYAIENQAPVVTPSNPDVRNNILHAGQVCFLEAQAIANAATFSYNDLICTTALYRRVVPATDFTTPAALGGAGFPFNVTDAPAYNNTSDLFTGFQLTASAPCSVVKGGDPALIGTVTVDRLNVARTGAAPAAAGVGPSMGAYEQENGCI
ncbi:MAG: right-handed parallel beta-helix repeat-containing protein [Leptospirales bacterium]|nr:right-handed parallel beta-helix repeat-containing protein [Leptospirales bacterium]